MSVPRRDILARILEKTAMIAGASGCWIWLNATVKGRPCLSIGHAQHINVARWMFEKFRGPLPSDKLACHTCDVGLCINPEHLYAGTHSTNMQDSYDRGRRGKQVGQAKKTHCKRGHLFRPETTWVRQYQGASYRVCLVCQAEQRPAWDARYRANRKLKQKGVV